LRHKVLYPYLHIIRIRAAHPAFHPAGSQQVLSLDPTLFALLRGAPDGSESLLCIHNVSNAERLMRGDLDALAFSNAGHVRDLIAGAIFRVDTSGTLNLCIAPYQVLWLKGNGF
jgi:sucrose phosphorylase